MWTLEPGVLLGALAAALLLRWLWRRRGLYRLSLRLPGPFSLPLVGSAYSLAHLVMRNDLTRNLMRDARIFDGLYRLWIGPGLFIGCTKAEDIECLLTCRVLSAKPPYLFRHWMESMGAGILTLPGITPKWKTHRKAISPSFSSAVLDGQHEALQRHSRLLVQDMRALCGRGLVDYSAVIGRYCGDCVAETLFDTPYNLREGREDIILHSIEVICEAFYHRICRFWYHVGPIYRMSSIHAKQKASTHALFSFGKKILEKKRVDYDEKRRLGQLPSERPSTMEVILEAEHSGQFSEEDTLAEFVNVWAAGMDTTCVDIMFFILMMAMHKDAQDTLWREIRNLYEHDRDAPVEKEHFLHMPYLDWCTKEVLRLFPVGPITLRQSTEKFHLKSKNIDIPRDVTIAIVSYVTHRDPAYWRRPDDFLPERFSPEQSAGRHPYAFIPFSGGPRNCIGQRFGQNLVKTAMVYLLRQYEFQSDWKLSELPLAYDISTRSRWGYQARVSPRRWDLGA